MATYLDLTGLQTYHKKIKAYVDGLNTAIEAEVAKKQGKLTAGTGITIDEATGVISFSGDATIFVYVDTLPSVDEAKLDKIYVVASEKTETGNLYTEWYVKVTGSTKAWEKLGEFKEGIDLDDYYTKEETTSLVDNKLADYAKSADVYTKTAAESMVDGKLASYAKSTDVYDKTTANGRFVKVSENITTEQIDNIFA